MSSTPAIASAAGSTTLMVDAANSAKLDADLAPAVKRLHQGGPVVLPLDGLVTGMSDMPNRCPLTFAYLQRSPAELASIK